MIATDPDYRRAGLVRRQFEYFHTQSVAEGDFPFKLCANHQEYEALDREFARPKPPYAWYLRVPDLPRFLWHNSPVLEKRLFTSGIAGYSGSLKLNFHQS